MDLKYVSFEEAIKATTQGIGVASWLNNETKPYHIHLQSYDELGELIFYKFELLGDEIERFNEIKWTIWEK